jgi:hypothetical protein
LALLAGGAVLASARPSHAFERQHHLGVEGGFGILKVADKDTLDLGGGGQVHYAYGISDAFNFLVEGGYFQVALEEASGQKIPANRPTGVSNLGVGIAYVLDVVRWVPYGGVLADGYLFTGGNLEKPRFAAGLALALGLDYQISRNFAVGFAFRQHFALSAITDYPSYSQFFLRAEYVWGW